MSEKKKRKATKERLERRFRAEATHTSKVAAGLGMAGSLALGAGVFGQWVAETPMRFAAALVTVGSVGLGAGLWLGSASTFPVLVGDSGIAIERGAELVRVLWCDIEEIRLQSGDLLISSRGITLSIPIGAHPKATPFIVAEADRRLPRIVKLSDADRRAIPLLKEPGGTEVPVRGDQVAGRRCAATQKIISFERDARLCPRCAQVYYKDAVPKECVTCGAEVAGQAVHA